MRRKREWAIRLALGLPASRVIALVVGQGALLVTAGVGVGLAGAAALAQVLSSFLYDVRTVDPISFALPGRRCWQSAWLRPLSPPGAQGQPTRWPLCASSNSLGGGLRGATAILRAPV